MLSRLFCQKIKILGGDLQIILILSPSVIQFSLVWFECSISNVAKQTQTSHIFHRMFAELIILFLIPIICNEIVLLPYLIYACVFIVKMLLLVQNTTWVMVGRQMA